MVKVRKEDWKKWVGIIGLAAMVILVGRIFIEPNYQFVGSAISIATCAILASILYTGFLGGKPRNNKRFTYFWIFIFVMVALFLRYFNNYLVPTSAIVDFKRLSILITMDVFIGIIIAVIYRELIRAPKSAY